MDIDSPGVGSVKQIRLCLEAPENCGATGSRADGPGTRPDGPTTGVIFEASGSRSGSDEPD